MPKPKNPVASVKIMITTTATVREYLDRLVKEGLHGKNAAEAAERVIARYIEGLVREGGLQRIIPPELK